MNTQLLPALIPAALSFVPAFRGAKSLDMNMSDLNMVELLNEFDAIISALPSAETRLARLKLCHRLHDIWTELSHATFGDPLAFLISN